jgi:hypothetical protein
MESTRVCALCGEAIDAGQAWMTSDRDGAERVAHSGCVYRDESPEERAWWMPSDWGPGE